MRLAILPPPGVKRLSTDYNIIWALIFCNKKVLFTIFFLGFMSHEILRKNMIGIKETFIHLDFAANPKSIDDNFKLND